MKKPAIFAIFILFIFSYVGGKSKTITLRELPKEIYIGLKGSWLSNTLDKSLRKGKPKKAVNKTLKLNKTSKELLIFRIHSNLPQYFAFNDLNLTCSSFLELLILKNNTEINKIIEPLYFWRIAKKTENADSLKMVLDFLDSFLDHKINYESHAEKYCLLVLKELETTGKIDKQTRHAFLKRIISNLKQYPCLDTINKSAEIMQKRAWIRCLLAYSYYNLYSVYDNNTEFLYKANYYSPDGYDIRHSNKLLFDASILTRSKNQISYREKYQEFIKSRDQDKLLTELSEMAYIDPVDNNLNKLKSYYKELFPEKKFEDYWFLTINNKSQPVPHVKVGFKSDTLDFSKNKITGILLIFGEPGVVHVGMDCLKFSHFIIK